MTTDTTHLIVGASLGGAKAAETLRAEGFDGPLILIGRDSDRLKAAFQDASRVAIIGGGWIGLETAAAARTAGAAVTVLERGELPLLRVLGREAAEVFADLHREHGVDLRCGVQVAEITGS